MKTQAAVFWTIVFDPTHILVYDESVYKLRRRRRLIWVWLHSKTIKYRIEIVW